MKGVQFIELFFIGGAGLQFQNMNNFILNLKIQYSANSCERIYHLIAGG